MRRLFRRLHNRRYPLALIALLFTAAVLTRIRASDSDLPAPKPQPRRAPVEKKELPQTNRDLIPLLSLDSIAPPPVDDRDLFAYYAIPEPVIEPEPVVVAELPAPPPLLPIVDPAPQPPRFPYRYIGRFGTAARPIAAFTGDDGVITVREGEPIGSGFTLQRIGNESVEVIDSVVRLGQRIPLGG